MQKIDFFGGLHGNFLEVSINYAINQNGYDITKPQFTKDGACHLKIGDISYLRIISAQHFSYNELEFDHNDRVVRIVPSMDDLLIGFTNSFLRAGDEMFDIDNLENNTLTKLSKIEKSKNFVNTLVQDHGIKTDYSRSALRNYFYSMLTDQENGLELLTRFTPVDNPVYNFSFRSFFDIGMFYYELNKVANFLELNFYPTLDLAKFHSDFLSLNQGYHSEVKCKQVLQAILHGKSMDINLNLIEEAWINNQLIRCFRCHDLPILWQDQYATNTLELSQAVFDWKSRDYPTESIS